MLLFEKSRFDGGRMAHNAQPHLVTDFTSVCRNLNSLASRQTFPKILVTLVSRCTYTSVGLTGDEAYQFCAFFSLYFVHLLHPLPLTSPFRLLGLCIEPTPFIYLQHKTQIIFNLCFSKDLTSPPPYSRTALLLTLHTEA